MEWEKPAEFKAQMLISRSCIVDADLDPEYADTGIPAEQSRKARHPIVNCILCSFFNGIIKFLSPSLPLFSRLEMLFPTIVLSSLALFFNAISQDYRLTGDVSGMDMNYGKPM
jgi:hypothetical protein